MFASNKNNIRIKNFIINLLNIIKIIINIIINRKLINFKIIRRWIKLIT